MLLVVKTKCLNFVNISDICDKFNFITNDTIVQERTHLIKQHIHVTIFNIMTERSVKEFPLQFHFPHC